MLQLIGARDSVRHECQECNECNECSSCGERNNQNRGYYRGAKESKKLCLLVVLGGRQLIQKKPWSILHLFKFINTLLFALDIILHIRQNKNNLRLKVVSGHLFFMLFFSSIASSVATTMIIGHAKRFM